MKTITSTINQKQKLFKFICFICLLTVCLLPTALNAQTPQAFKYQAVVRDNSGNVLVNKNVSFKISILETSTSGTTVYSETQTSITNQFGLANLNIGSGTVVSGTFSTINWGNDTYFVKIEFDPAGGSNYTLMGTSQLLSVPYALHAKTVEKESQTLAIAGDTLSISSGNKIVLPKSTGGGSTYLVLAGDITNAEAAQRIKDEAGANTQFIWVINTKNLTTLNFIGVSKLVEIKIMNNDALLNVTFPDLTAVWSGSTIGSNKALVSLSFPALTATTGISKFITQH